MSPKSKTGFYKEVDHKWIHIKLLIEALSDMHIFVLLMLKMGQCGKGTMLTVETDTYISRLVQKWELTEDSQRCLTLFSRYGFDPIYNPANEYNNVAEVFQFLQNTKPATIYGQDLSVLLYYEADLVMGMELKTLSQGQIYFSVWHCWRKKKLQLISLKQLAVTTLTSPLSGYYVK